MTEVYKLLLNEDGKLISYSATGDAEMTYSTTEVNRPSIAGSKIFVFDSYNSAMEWLYWPQSLGFSELWLCEGEDAEPIEWMASSAGTWSVDQFWKGKLEKPLQSKPPQGTLGVSSLILKERVK